MCTLAAEDSDTWLMVDTWEAFQSYQRTAIVLDHFDHEINTVLGGVRTQDGEQRKVRVMLLAGSDLIGTMSEPGVWIYSDVCPYLISPYMLGAQNTVHLQNTKIQANDELLHCRRRCQDLYAYIRLGNGWCQC